MDTGAAVMAVVARARAERPELTIDDARLRAHIEAVTAPARLATAHAGDLALACGCAAGDVASLRAFEAEHGAMLAAAVRAVDPNPGAIDEVLQELRQRLFVADGEQPARIYRYAGTGPLGGWLRVAAVRLAIDLRRRGWREVALEDAMVHAAASDDDPAGRHDLAVVRAALRAAIVAQPSRSRTLLRYYYGEQVGVVELGRLYRVNASTVSRWLSQARDAIFAETRRKLAEALGAAPGDVESHLGLVADLEVSLGSLLKTPTP